MSHNPSRSAPRRGRVVLGLAMIAGLLLTNVQAASANEEPIGAGSEQMVGVTDYWTNPRTNSQVKNRVSVQFYGNTAAGGMDIAIRGTAPGATTFARNQSNLNANWTDLRHDNGNYWVSWGTFYTSTTQGGGCGGTGCGWVSWSGKLRWNIAY